MKGFFMFLSRRDDRIPSINGRLTLRTVSGNRGEGFAWNLFGWGQGSMVSSTEHGTKPSVFVKGREFLRRLSLSQEGFCSMTVVQIFAVYVCAVHGKDLFCVLVAYQNFLACVRCFKKSYSFRDTQWSPRLQGLSQLSYISVGCLYSGFWLYLLRYIGWTRD